MKGPQSTNYCASPRPVDISPTHATRSHDKHKENKNNINKPKRVPVPQSSKVIRVAWIVVDCCVIVIAYREWKDAGGINEKKRLTEALRKLKDYNLIYKDFTNLI